MTMIYFPKGRVPIKYDIITDPPEAMYWETYKLKKNDIKIITKLDRTAAAEMRAEILADILETEKPDAPEGIKTRKSPAEW